MKKVICLVLAVFSVSLIFASCGGNRKGKVSPMQSVKEVVKIQNAQFDKENCLSFRIKNLSKDKTIEQFGVVARKIKDGKIWGQDDFIERGVDCDPYDIAPGQQSEMLTFDIKKTDIETEVYIAFLSYSDGTDWINSELAFTENLRSVSSVYAPVDNVFILEDVSTDRVKMKFNLNNISPAKTIKTYEIQVNEIFGGNRHVQEFTSKRLLRVSNVTVEPMSLTGEVALCKRSQYWLKSTQVTVIKIFYTDGTVWLNPCLSE